MLSISRSSHLALSLTFLPLFSLLLFSRLFESGALNAFVEWLPEGGRDCCRVEVGVDGPFELEGLAEVEKPAEVEGRAAIRADFRRG
jgi:hypothetical protein